MTRKPNDEELKPYIDLIPSEKYNHPGVYKITVNGQIVYVGKARNMRIRVATHLYMIDKGTLTTKGERCKYEELRRARAKGYDISFDVLYTSSIVYDFSNTKEVDDDVGPQEAKYIRLYMPKLNSQIPSETNYHSYSVKPYELLDI